MYEGNHKMNSGASSSRVPIWTKKYMDSQQWGTKFVLFRYAVGGVQVWVVVLWGLECKGDTRYHCLRHGLVKTTVILKKALRWVPRWFGAFAATADAETSYMALIY